MVNPRLTSTPVSAPLSKLTLLYAGVPRFALALAQAGHRLTAVCLPWLQEDEDTWALVKHTSAHGIPVLPAAAITQDATAEDREFLTHAAAADLVLVMSFEHLVEPWACALGAHGAWNMHPSLLPRHRGYNPYFWTVMHGDTQAGVTLHEMTPEFDAGPVLAQRSVQASTDTTGGELWENLQDASELLVLEVVAAAARGQWPVPVPQNATHTTRAPKLRDAHLTLDLHAPAMTVVRHVRAATPEPGALMTLGGEVLRVLGASLGPLPPPGCRAGQVFRVDQMCYVALGQGSFRPHALERHHTHVLLDEFLEAP